MNRSDGTASSSQKAAQSKITRTLRAANAVYTRRRTIFFLTPALHERGGSLGVRLRSFRQHQPFLRANSRMN